MEKGEYLLDEDELVGRTTAVHSGEDDRGSAVDDRLVANAEEGGEGTSGRVREDDTAVDEVDVKGVDEGVREGAPGDVRPGRESYGSGRRMPSRRTKLAVALVALGFVGAAGLWWVHGRTDVKREANVVAKLPPELAKVLRPGRPVVIHRSAQSLGGAAPSGGAQAPGGAQSPASNKPLAGSTLAGNHPSAGSNPPAGRRIAPAQQAPAGGIPAGRRVSGAGLLPARFPVESKAPAGKDSLALAGGDALAGGKFLASGKSPAGGPPMLPGKTMRVGESSRGSSRVPAVRRGPVPRNGAGGGGQTKVLEEIDSLKTEVAGVKVALANERKAVGALPDMDRRLVVLHGALEKLLKKIEAGSHAKVRSGTRREAHTGSRSVKRVMGYRLLAVVGDQAVVEDAGTGRVKVLRANERLGGLVVYQVSGGAVVTNYGVMMGDHDE